MCKLLIPIIDNFLIDWAVGEVECYPLPQKNSAVCVRTRTVNVNTFSTTVKYEISEGW